MRIINFTLCLMVAFAVVFAATGVTQAQRLYLQVDRNTGTVSAISSGDIQVDGYTIRSAGGLLDPEGWNSLSDQGVEGWSEANPAASHLSELNWAGSTGLTAGVAVQKGTAYNPAGVLPEAEDLEFEYSTPDGVFGTGDVIYSGIPQVPGITVHRQTGEINLVNALGFDLAGYSINSTSGSLSTDGFNGLTDQNASGWVEANPTANSLSELNLEESTRVDASSPINIGSAFTPGGTEDLSFEYSVADGEFGKGLVTYEGVVNDLTLQVNLLTGAAQILNPTDLAGDFSVTGYNIFSDSGALSPENWTSLTDSGAEGWSEANPSANSLAELNPSSARLFDGGASFSLGNIFVGAEADLVFEYAVEDGTVANGTIDYVLDGGPIPPVCNPNTLGDIDGNGMVAFADFLILAENFGANAGVDHTDGDIDCNGEVAFADFLILAENFGAEVGQASAVPEPASGLLAMLATLVLLTFRKRP